MPIPPAVRESCLEIMDTVMKRPCASPFLRPVSKDDAPGYDKVVKKPIDLGTIRQRLVDDEYPSVAAWSKDMSLIWQNAEKFNGKDSHVCITAFEVKKNFEKEYRKLKNATIQKWAQVVSELKDKLDELLDNPPDPVTKFATISEKPDPNEVKPFTDEEMDHFIRCSMLLSNQKDANKMRHIIRVHDPRFTEGEDANEIDVGQLSVQTLHALRDYVMQRLNDQGITPPK